MDRRAFLGTPALLVTPLTAEAQTADKRFRIGYLALDRAQEDSRPREAFFQGLRDLGYVEGRNLVIEYRDAGGRTDRLRALAAELAALKPDVIVTAGGTTVPGAIAPAAGERGDPVARPKAAYGLPSAARATRRRNGTRTVAASSRPMPAFELTSFIAPVGRRTTRVASSTCGDMVTAGVAESVAGDGIQNALDLRSPGRSATRGGHTFGHTRMANGRRPLDAVVVSL
jgi:hypothetical protein